MQTKGDNWERKLEEIKKAAIKVNVEGCLKFLRDVFERKIFIIKSNHPTIKNIGCHVWKEEIGFGFETDDFNNVPSPARYQSTLYGVTTISLLEKDGISYHIKDGPLSATVPLGQRFHGKGKFNSLECNLNEDKGYFISIIPVKQGTTKGVDIILGQAFKDGGWVRHFGYLPICVKDLEVGFYDFSVDKQTFLLIESKSKTNFSAFKKITDIVIYVFGLLTGYLERKEIFTLRSADPSFEKINAFQLKELKTSRWGLPALNPKEHRLLYNLRETSYMSLGVFNNLINRTLENLELYRAIQIITESFEYPFYLQASTHSVALETIKNFIVKDNEEKLRPIKKKEIASEFINDIKIIFSKIADSEINNRESIAKKIENINSLGNSESLFKLFELLHINLNDDDKRCISKRNDFLHGKMPFDTNSELNNDYELEHVVYKLHFLLCACILKLAGFSGYLRNNLKMADHMKFNKGLQEDFYRKI